MPNLRRVLSMADATPTYAVYTMTGLGILSLILLIIAVFAVVGDDHSEQFAAVHQTELAELQAEYAAETSVLQGNLDAQTENIAALNEQIDELLPQADQRISDLARYVADPIQILPDTMQRMTWRDGTFESLGELVYQVGRSWIGDLVRQVATGNPDLVRANFDTLAESTFSPRFAKWLPLPRLRTDLTNLQASFESEMTAAVVRLCTEERGGNWSNSLSENDGRSWATCFAYRRYTDGSDVFALSAHVVNQALKLVNALSPDDVGSDEPDPTTSASTSN